MVDKNGRRVLFVANPSIAPVRKGWVYARPDDSSDEGISWRERLAAYNRNNIATIR